MTISKADTGNNWVPLFSNYVLPAHKLNKILWM